MSRLFDGVDDLMTYDPGFGVDGANDHTLLVVVKNVAGSSWASLIEAEDSGGAIVVAIGRRSNGRLYYAWTASLNDGGASTAITATGTWWVLAVSKVGGSSAPRFHKVDTGGANPVHTSGGAASGGGPATRIKLGGDDDPANIRLAVAALFDKALSDAEVESIASDLSTQAIADLAPVALYDDSDAFATNLVNPGTYDRSALTGTADDADDPAGWTYGLSGGGAHVFGAASLDLTDSIATAGKKQAHAASAVAISSTLAAAGKRNAHGAISVPLAAAITAAGKKNAHAAAGLAETLGIAAAGKRDAHAGAALGLTISTAAAGSRSAHGAVSFGETLSTTASGKKRAVATTAVPLVFTIDTTGAVSGVVDGAASLALAFGAATAGKKNARAAAALPVSASITTTGQRRVLGSATFLAAISASTAGGRTANGSLSLPLAVAAAVAGHRGAVGAVTLPLVLTFDSNGATVGLSTTRAYAGSGRTGFPATSPKTRASAGLGR